MIVYESMYGPPPYMAGYDCMGKLSVFPFQKTSVAVLENCNASSQSLKISACARA